MVCGAGSRSAVGAVLYSGSSARVWSGARRRRARIRCRRFIRARAERGGWMPSRSPRMAGHPRACGAGSRALARRVDVQGLSAGVRSGVRRCRVRTRCRRVIRVRAERGSRPAGSMAGARGYLRPRSGDAPNGGTSISIRVIRVRGAWRDALQHRAPAAASGDPDHLRASGARCSPRGALPASPGSFLFTPTVCGWLSSTTALTIRLTSRWRILWTSPSVAMRRTARRAM